MNFTNFNKRIFSKYPGINWIGTSGTLKIDEKRMVTITINDPAIHQHYTSYKCEIKNILLGNSIAFKSFNFNEHLVIDDNRKSDSNGIKLISYVKIDWYNAPKNETQIADIIFNWINQYKIVEDKKKFIVLTDEGTTMSPNGKDVENLQVLAILESKDKELAELEFKHDYKKMLKDGKWKNYKIHELI